MSEATARVIHGEALATLKTLPDASVDAVCSDPPAGIGFMGKTWDQPNGYGFTDGGNRVGIMPTDRASSRNPSCKKCCGRQRAGPATKACECDKPDWNTTDRRLQDRGDFITFLSAIMAEALRVARPGAVALVWALPRTSHWTATALEDAGWLIEDRISHLFGQGFPKHHSKLKPACEDWWLCRKPGPKWLGVEECRIPTSDDMSRPACNGRHMEDRPWVHRRIAAGLPSRPATPDNGLGRWPANACLTCCGNDPHDEDCAVRLLDEQSGTLKPPGSYTRRMPASNKVYGHGCGNKEADRSMPCHGGQGGASRFFYVAKASRKDRSEGNSHPTVKSTALMRWLVRLACPAGGTVLDPFAGSGTTGVACLQEGRSFIGIEQDANYVKIARKRIAEEQSRFPLFV
jgi:site-specific DNA-methyltransferase (adenine-specific)